MALITSAWLMGSDPDVPSTDIEVTMNAVTETLSIPAGPYYVQDTSITRSAANALRTALLTHSEAGTISCFLRRDLLIQLDSSVSMTIDSWSDTTFRDVLGFGGEEGIAFTSLNTLNQSRYLWSPGRCEIPDAALGTQGLLYKDTQMGMSGDRVAIATTNNTGRRNRFQFRAVYAERVHTTSEAGGEYYAWWDQVQSRFYRFKLYREVTEETTTDATSANLNGEVLGPYVWEPSGTPITFEYSRVVQTVELLNNVEIPVLLQDEY